MVRKVVGIAAVAAWLVAASLVAAAPARVSRWRIERTPAPPNFLNSQLLGVSCASAGTCMAVGYYTRVGGNKTFAERWGARRWSLVRTPAPPGALTDYLDGVSCTSARACVAVGGYENHAEVFVTLAERWNGTRWAVEPTPNPPGASSNPELDGVSCVSTRFCTAIGFYTNRELAYRPFAERWNGKSWVLQHTPAPRGPFDVGLNGGVSCASARACTAVGYTRGLRPLAERWNGTRWSIQRTPKPAAPASALRGVSCAAAGACAAVGFSVDKAHVESAMAERWQHRKWSLQRTPKPAGAGFTGLLAVSCSAARACIAVGHYGRGGTTHPQAELWDGTSWNPQHPSAPAHTLGGDLYGVSCPTSRTCVAVGDYVDYSGTGWPLAERWTR